VKGEKESKVVGKKGRPTIEELFLESVGCYDRQANGGDVTLLQGAEQPISD